MPLWVSLPSLTHRKQPHPRNAGAESLNGGCNSLQTHYHKGSPIKAPSALFLLSSDQQTVGNSITPR